MPPIAVRTLSAHARSRVRAARIRGTVARIFFDLRDAGEDLHRRFGWLDRDARAGREPVRPTARRWTSSRPRPASRSSSTCRASRREAVSVTYRDGAVVVAGHKRPTRCHHGQAAFHLAERSFGRFARAVQLGGAFDASRARATLAAGELRIVLPRIDERRGRRRIRIARRHPARAARSRPMRILFVGDIFGKPGREIARRAIPALVAARRHRLRHRQRRELRRRLRRHRRHRRHDPRLRRRRDDDRQSRLGQEGSPRLHPAPAEAAAARRTSRPARRAAAATSAGRAPASRSACST